MPKVSFYLRNEDVEAWKSIDKKTAWMHEHLNWDISREKVVIDGVPTATPSIMETRVPIPPTPLAGSQAMLNSFERAYKFCKHDAVLGMCKKGCK